MTATMRAITQDRFGGPEVLQLKEVARPSAGPAQVLVRVEASGINPTDWKHRAAGRFLRELPLTLGWDVAGTVVAVGTGVAVLEPGDTVLGMLPYPGQGGGYAEYVAAPARTFTRRPSSMDLTTGAALPLASLTAWQALVDVANVQAGERVLIHAAAGGVGHLAVQMAKHRGADVVATASASKHDFVRALGVDEVIDYQNEDFSAVVRDVDVVLDSVGGDYGLRSLRTMRPGGRYVTITPGRVDPALMTAAQSGGIRAKVMLVERDHATLNEIVRLVTADALRVTVSQSFPAAEVARAHEAGEGGRTSGKMVLVW